MSHVPKLTTKYYTCMVPLCKNNNIQSPNKVFIQIPTDKKRRKQWFLEVRRRDDNCSNLYACEDHFDLEKDMQNYVKWKLMGGRKYMKKEVVPHRFDCQPERNVGIPPIPADVDTKPTIKTEAAIVSPIEFVNVMESPMEETVIERPIKIERPAMQPPMKFINIMESPMKIETVSNIKLVGVVVKPPMMIKRPAGTTEQTRIKPSIKIEETVIKPPVVFERVVLESTIKTEKTVTEPPMKIEKIVNEPTIKIEACSPSKAFTNLTGTINIESQIKLEATSS